MAKVIRPGGMFFEDDIKIIDAELDSDLGIPAPLPIFSRDELQILYNGHIFIASKKQDTDKKIKVYTCTYGLEEADSPKTQEDKYFSENSDLVERLKSDFIERVVNGITEIGSGSARERAGSQLGQELAGRISGVYEKLKKPLQQTPAGKGLITRLDDASVFNTEMQGCERVLLLDGKLYDLTTIPEYIAVFENSMDPEFYKELRKASEKLTPKEISELITSKKDKVHRKVVPMLRNKIWHSPRSGELYLDSTFFIPQFRQGYDTLTKLYQKLLEKKIKIDAARSIKW